MLLVYIFKGYVDGITLTQFIRARLRTELGVSRKELTMHLQQCIVVTRKYVNNAL